MDCSIPLSRLKKLSRKSLLAKRSKKSLRGLSPKRSKKSLDWARAGATPTTTTSASIAASVISFLKVPLLCVFLYGRFYEPLRVSHAGGLPPSIERRIPSALKYDLGLWGLVEALGALLCSRRSFVRPGSLYRGLRP